jgi:hypothetical protein
MQMTECGSEVEQLILRLSTSLRMRNFAMCGSRVLCAALYRHVLNLALTKSDNFPMTV